MVDSQVLNAVVVDIGRLVVRATVVVHLVLELEWYLRLVAWSGQDLLRLWQFIRKLWIRWLNGRLTPIVNKVIEFIRQNFIFFELFTLRF